MHKLILLTLCFFMAFTLTLQSEGKKEGGAEDVIVVKVAHVNPPGDPSYEAWEFFKKLIEEKSKGRFKINLYGAGQISMDERELIEQAKVGSLDIVSANVAPVALHFKKFDIFNLPYLWRDEQHIFNFCDGPAGKQLAEEFEKAVGIELLAYWDNGVRNCFHRKKPLTTPDEFKGQKIRVMNNDVYITFFAALGANPMPMAYGEVYTALQTGVVDIADNDTSGYRAMKFYEVAPNYSLTAHTIMPKIVLASQSFMAKLPADLKPVFDEAVQETLKFQRETYVNARLKDIQWMKDQGINVYEVKNLKPFQEIARTSVWVKYEDAIGKELIEKAINTK